MSVFPPCTNLVVEDIPSDQSGAEIIKPVCSSFAITVITSVAFPAVERTGALFGVGIAAIFAGEAGVLGASGSLTTAGFCCPWPP